LFEPNEARFKGVLKKNMILITAVHRAAPHLLKDFKVGREQVERFLTVTEIVFQKLAKWLG
jgi:hypothetical protein